MQRHSNALSRDKLRFAENAYFINEYERSMD